MLDEKGMLDIEKVQHFFYAPAANTYYRMGGILRRGVFHRAGFEKEIIGKWYAEVDFDGIHE